MKLMILIIIGLTIYPIPLVGGIIRNILFFILLFQLVTRLPQILRNLFSPRRVM